VSFILVTNDDGIDSPALPALVRALAELWPVRAVVPSRERSWIGKAITRWEDIRVERVKRDGVEIHSVDGLPADCTQLGVHSLFDERPDMVVSGINVGFNHGLAFFLSSGTVGAACEGWIAGLPAIAFSTGARRNHNAWAPKAWANDSGPLWARMSVIAAEIVGDVRRVGFPEEADLLNVNIPESADLKTPRRVTTLAKAGYDNLFRRQSEGLYVHDFSGGFRRVRQLEGTDLETDRRGLVSITPVRLAHSVSLAVPTRRALERS
jgi:5'-nucleotidase